MKLRKLIIILSIGFLLPVASVKPIAKSMAKFGTAAIGILSGVGMYGLHKKFALQCPYERVTCQNLAIGSWLAATGAAAILLRRSTPHYMFQRAHRMMGIHGNHFYLKQSFASPQNFYDAVGKRFSDHQWPYRFADTELLDLNRNVLKAERMAAVAKFEDDEIDDPENSRYDLVIKESREHIAKLKLLSEALADKQDSLHPKDGEAVPNFIAQDRWAKVMTPSHK